MLEWRAFMGRHYREGNVEDASNVYAYITAQTMMQVLKQCGNDFSRENIKKQAQNFGAEFMHGSLLEADLSKRPFRLNIESRVLPLIQKPAQRAAHVHGRPVADQVGCNRFAREFHEHADERFDLTQLKPAGIPIHDRVVLNHDVFIDRDVHRPCRELGRMRGEQFSEPFPRRTHAGLRAKRFVGDRPPQPRPIAALGGEHDCSARAKSRPMVSVVTRFLE